MVEGMAGPLAGVKWKHCGTAAACAAALLLLCGLIEVADARGNKKHSKAARGKRVAPRSRAPAQCRTGYNSVIWRSPQCGKKTTISAFARDASGKHFFDSIGISDASGCTTLGGGACAYPSGNSACHGSCCAVRISCFQQLPRAF